MNSTGGQMQSQQYRLEANQTQTANETSLENNYNQIKFDSQSSGRPTSKKEPINVEDSKVDDVEDQMEFNKDSGSQDSVESLFYKTDVYYCIGLKCQQDHKHQEYDLTKIKGQLTVSKNLMFFEPNESIPEQTAKLLKKEGLAPNHFQACIDYQDIVSI